MSNLVRLLAVLANLGLLAFGVFLALTSSSFRDWTDFLAAALILGTPVVNLGWMLLSARGNEPGWFGLWLKRKALEEQKKIRELESETPGAKV